MGTCEKIMVFRADWRRTDRANSFAIAIFHEFTLRHGCEVLVSGNFVSVLCSDAEETLSADSGRESQIWGPGEMVTSMEVCSCRSSI